MPIENSHDPREMLVRRKYFNFRPQPLEQWIWRQGIAPSAERVFWLHWQAGMRSRDWCSSIPLKRVAALCALDVSSVTRAYHALAKLGLIRRQDPGRDPTKPFEQAVAITEVRVPRELLQELGRHPDRPAFRAQGEVPEQALTEVTASPKAHTHPSAPAATLCVDPFKGLSGRERRGALNGLLAPLSANERRQYDEALRTQRPYLSFDEGSQLDAKGRATLLQFLEIAAAKPTVAATAVTLVAPDRKPQPRRLSVFELARLRRELHAHAGFDRAPQLLREVVWAVEQGALSRFTPLHGLRIALKKIREGAWTRPNRMPPNWSRELAHPEQCRTA
jgi:hypothetical protein